MFFFVADLYLCAMGQRVFIAVNFYIYEAAQRCISVDGKCYLSSIGVVVSTTLIYRDKTTPN